MNDVCKKLDHIIKGESMLVSRWVQGDLDKCNSKTYVRVGEQARPSWGKRTILDIYKVMENAVELE